VPFDRNNRILVMPTALWDMTVKPALLQGANNPLHVQLFDSTTTAGVILGSVANPLITSLVNPPVGAPSMKIGKIAATAAGSTAIFTSSVGKKARLYGGILLTDAGLAAAGNEVISILDVAADINLDFQRYLPIAAAIIPQTPIPFDLKPNGYLMAATNTVLNVNLSAAATAGAITGAVWYTEE
jgi:hypothetical protein